MAGEHKQKPEFGSHPNSPVRREKSFFIPFVILLLLNIAVFIYAASNIVIVHENQKKIVRIDRALSTLKGEGDNAKRGDITREAFDALAERVTALEKALSGDRTGWPDGDAAERLMLSAPGRYVSQRLQPPPANSLEELLAPGQGAAEAAVAPGGNLPHYERHISPDGKLILRKVE